MQTNADAYINSIFNPFGVRDCRVPELSAFPSTVGSVVTKGTLTAIFDTPSSGPPDDRLRWGISLMPNLTGSFNAGTAFIGTFNSYDSFAGTLTVSGAPHPQITAFQSSFGLIRVVSMGLRLINTGVLIERSGTLFCNINAFGEQLFTPSEAEGFLVDLQSSPDTIMLDFAQIGEQGIEINWLPLSLAPTLSFQDENVPGYILNATGAMYVDPSMSALTTNFCTVHDTQILLWGQTESGDSGGINLEYEYIVNYEAIPFPQTAFLHELKSVAGSEDHIAVAYEKAGRQGAKTAVAGMVSNVNTLGPKPAGPVSATLGGASVGSMAGGLGSIAQNLLRDVSGIPIVSQIISAGKGLLAGALGGMGGAALRSKDGFAAHQLAIHSGLNHLSPRGNKQTRGLTKREFLKLLIDTLDAQTPDAPEDKKDSEPPTPDSYVRVELRDDPLGVAAKAAAAPMALCLPVPKAGKPGTPDAIPRVRFAPGTKA